MKNPSLHPALAGPCLSLALLFATGALEPAGHAACTPPPAGLVAWWPGQGNATDAEGLHQGALINGDYTNGEVGLAFYLNGSNACVRVPDAPGLDPAHVTVEGWFKLDALDAPVAAYPGLEYLVFKQNSRAAQFEGYALEKNRVNGVDVFQFEIASAAGQQVSAASVTVPQVGVWYHLAGTYDGATVNLYVNGALEGVAPAGFPLDYGAHPLFIGTTGQPFDGRFEGAADEVDIYNRALSSNEIAAIYLAGGAGKCPLAPFLSLEPTNLTVTVGGTATFGVLAGGTTPLSYCWNRNGAPIPGATNASYSLLDAQSSDSGGTFSCLITNAYGTATSANVLLKVVDTVANGLCSGAIVVTHANNTNAQSTLKANAPANPALDCVPGFGHVVWYEFTAPVSGLLLVDTFGSDFDTGLGVFTGSCDALTEVACNDDAGGGVTSQVVAPTTAGTTYYIAAGGYDSDAGNLVLHLNHLTPPAFAVWPSNVFATISSNASFNPVVSGTLPMAFQWYFDNLPLVDGGRISGSTNAILAIADVQTNDGGNYRLVASNLVGVTTSSVALLTPLFLPPSFIEPPTNQSIGLGSNVMFVAVAAGTPPFGYQWSLNGNPLVDDGVHLVGSATSSLLISNLTTADDGSYGLLVSNLAGAATAAATLTVMTPPAITLQPIGRSVPPGLPTVFTAMASGTPTPKFQWQLNGTNLPGGTGLNYSNPAVGAGDLGVYQLVASNLMGVAVSSNARLTFGPVAAWGRNANNESLPPPGLSNVVGVAGSLGTSFAIRADGTVATWGGLSALPVRATNVVAISSFGINVANYALQSDGAVLSWYGLSAPALSNVVAVAAGMNFGYALRAEGILTYWGNVPTPGFPAGLGHLTAIAAGYRNAVALRDDGMIFVAGGGPVTNVPAGLSNVVAVAAGNTFALALEADGTVVAWGAGAGTNPPPGATNVAAISAGNASENLAFAIRADGTLLAWGDHEYGATNPPAALGSLVSVAGAAVDFHGLALVNDGGPQIIQPPVGLTAYNGRGATLRAGVVGAAPLSCQWLLNGAILSGATNTTLVLSNLQAANAGSYRLWVSNSISTALSPPAPVNVISNNGLSFLGQLAGSSSNIYQGGKVALSSGPVLGNGPLSYQWYFSPTTNYYTAVAGATNDSLVLEPALAAQSGNYYVAVSNQVAGLASAPVTLRVRFAKAWGYLPADSPFVLTNATAIAVGNFGTGSSVGDYLALSAAGKISSWSSGQAAFGETNFSALSNSIVTAIAAGYADTLALKSDGTVFAAGYGQYGVTNVPAPANGITAIACGDYHDLALRYDGTVIGWGQNTEFQASPTTNAAVTNVVAIAAGGQDSIALRADGTVITWGRYGALPYGENPVPPSVTNVVAVAAGAEHFLALRANGTVVGWGILQDGQANLPASWTNIVAIAAGGNHSTVLRNDGTVASVGSSAGGLFSNSVPTDLANVIAIASGADHDLGLFGTRAPAFTVQPWNRTVFNTATSVWFAAKCAGVQPVRYQWQCNGTNVPGATNDTLTINAAVTNVFGLRTTLPLTAGVYQLFASNAYGVAASKYVQLNVLIPLGVALNATNLNWTSSGAGLWFGQTNYSHDGVAAAQSGAVGTLQQSLLRTTVATNVPGVYSFWWQVSSQPDFDVLEFRVNGLVQATLSGDVNWQHVTIPVPAGTNVLSWRYADESLYNSGLNAGWVDEFAFLPAPVILRQPTGVTANYGASIALSVLATGASPMGYQWTQNGNPVGGNNSVLILNNVTRAQDGTYFVTITNSGGVAVSGNAVVQVNVPQLLGAPTLLSNGALQFTSTDLGGGVLTPADLPNFTAQVSADLVNWVTLPNALSLTNGMLQLQDGAPTNYTTRFYRLVEQ